MAIKKLTKDNYEKETKKGPSIVKVFAPWCRACQVLAPIYKEVSNEEKKVKFFELNADDEPEKTSELGIRGIPVMIFYKDGKEVDRIIGLTEKEQIKKTIKKIL